MDKLTMAHEWAMKRLNDPDYVVPMDQFAADAWRYADAMQAEADKRNNKETCDKNIGLDSSVLKPSNSMELEWQPDWSQAPCWADWWAMDDCDYFWWYEKSPEMKNGGWCVSWASDDFEKAPSFNYQGNWQESLRKRPQ